MPLRFMRLSRSGFSSDRSVSMPALFRCQFVLFLGDFDETRRAKWIKMQMQMQCRCRRPDTHSRRCRRAE